MREQEIEKEIQSKGLNAPRLTPEHIDKKIANVHYYVVPGTTTTICCLTLLNGFNTVGTSAAASPENFDVELGQEIAFQNARNKIWELEGYLLKERLSTLKSPNEGAPQRFGKADDYNSDTEF